MESPANDLLSNDLLSIGVYATEPTGYSQPGPSAEGNLSFTQVSNRP
jgi:hypothetical protein